MIESTREYVDFLIDENITPNQYLFLYLIATDDLKHLYKYNSLGTPFRKSEIDDLVKKGLLIIHGATNSVDSYSVVKSFRDKINVVNMDPGQEFWESFPSFMWIQERKVPLKSTIREDFEEKYNKYVGKNLSRHRRIMRALEYAKSLNQVNMGIVKWFGSEMWVEIEKEREKVQVQTGPRYGERVF